MQLLPAKPVSEKIRATVKTEAAQFAKLHGRKPKLVVVLVGEDPASVIYTAKKGEACESVGFAHETIRLSADATPQEAKTVIDRLNADPAVDGILIQRPLPKTYREEDVSYWVTPAKDVDAFHPENVGRLSLGLSCLQPCTPTGVMEILEHAGVKLDGKTVCVVGRSSIVGKPMATLLMQKNATLLHCHSRTQNLETYTRQADVLVAAAGKPKLITEKHCKPGAVVIDVGIHRLPGGKVCGDVDAESVSRVASALTPVPGGVGPMTITILLRNTLLAARSSTSD
ncbi:MAG: bifunctional 5,10-methylenetetrahydrofolate dehydrogenase/5,10-methenyltetrahydrofolate cyclohydrolase [Bacteriovoracia bacterium]